MSHETETTRILCLRYMVVLIGILIMVYAIIPTKKCVVFSSISSPIYPKQLGAFFHCSTLWDFPVEPIEPEFSTILDVTDVTHQKLKLLAFGLYP